MKLSNDRLIKNAKMVFGLAWLRCKKLKCIPLYARTAKHKAEILRIYLQAQLTNSTSRIRVEVDHIIPLSNNLVCGLHTASNLQVISQKKNTAKGNVFVCYVQNAETGVITSLTELSSGVKYTKPVRKGRGRALKPKTQQKLAVKRSKNAVNKVKASKNRLKTVKKSLKTVKNGQKLYKKPQK